MSYALMLFEELFASQLSVPSSPVHPIKCTAVQMKKRNAETEEKMKANERGRMKKQRRIQATRKEEG